MNYYTENEGDNLWDEFQKEIRIPKIIYRTFMAILAIILILTAGYLIYLLNSSMKPVVKVEQINTSPENYLPSDSNLELLTSDERKKVFANVFLANSWGEMLNTEKYREEHPNDKIIKHRLAKASYDLVIFSDDRPDPKFLKVEELR